MSGSAHGRGSTAGVGRRSAARDGLDYYPTPYWATRVLCEWLRDQSYIGPHQSVWEPAAGGGHMAEVLAEYFGEVYATDVDDYGRGYPLHDMRQTLAPPPQDDPTDWVITNPPFQYAVEFAENCRQWADRGVALLCRTMFSESRGRYDQLFRERPPTDILLFVDRVTMAPGRLPRKGDPAATSYSWFVWRVCEENHYPTSMHWIGERQGDWNNPPAPRDLGAWWNGKETGQ